MQPVRGVIHTDGGWKRKEVGSSIPGCSYERHPRGTGWVFVPQIQEWSLQSYQRLFVGGTDKPGAAWLGRAGFNNVITPLQG